MRGRLRLGVADLIGVVMDQRNRAHPLFIGLRDPLQAVFDEVAPFNTEHTRRLPVSVRAIDIERAARLGK